MKLYYDLHLHSCLSPCGSEDMTPANLAAMCALAGLNVVALTDHNTIGNCASFCRAAEEWGLLALPGIELCTREEIHVVCLFPDLERAEIFDRYVGDRLPPYPNDPNIFGRQLRMDDKDSILEEDGRLLAVGADIGLEEVPKLVAELGGVSFPAHIDRPAFSLLSVLGLWDQSLGFSLAELSRSCLAQFTERPDLAGVRFVVNSDAHDLDQVWGAEYVMEPLAFTAEEVLAWLSGGGKPGTE